MRDKTTRICSVEGCKNKHKGHGFCENHLRKYRRWGDPCYVQQKAKCKVSGCKQKHKAKGYCEFHWDRKKRGSDLRAPKKTSNGSRLKFIMDTVANPPKDKCVIFPYALTNGYGAVLYKGVQRSASRVALMLYTGENPADKEACHGPCHNRACINPHPDHGMRWGTSKDNMNCLLYTSPSPRDGLLSRMPSSA